MEAASTSNSDVSYNGIDDLAPTVGTSLRYYVRLSKRTRETWALRGRHVGESAAIYL